MANACKLSSVLIFSFIGFLVVHYSVSQSMAVRTLPHSPEHTTSYWSRKLYSACGSRSGHGGGGAGRPVHHSLSQSIAVRTLPHPPELTTSYWSRKLYSACGSRSGHGGGGGRIRA